MDENKLVHRVQQLSYKLFMENAEGKELLRMMKILHVLTPTFPQSEQVIERHGGAVAWAAFREGQLTLIRSFELLAQNYLDKMAAENTKENV